MPRSPHRPPFFAALVVAPVLALGALALAACGSAGAAGRAGESAEGGATQLGAYPERAGESAPAAKPAAPLALAADAGNAGAASAAGDPPSHATTPRDTGAPLAAVDPMPLRPSTDWVAGAKTPAERVKHAKEDKGPVVKTLFASAGVSFPPAELLFRVFKQERELEVWGASAAGDSMKRVARYAVCAMSGGLGPKRAEGDRQVPEGFYSTHSFWPASSFHLSANIGYPNASDKVLGAKRPGSDIMIHGNCVSIGCIAMTDERVEELYAMSHALHAAGRRVNVHIFPARDVPALLADPAHAAHHAFWRGLLPALESFEKTRRLSQVKVDARGAYVFPTTGG